MELSGVRTYALLPVPVPDLGFMNIYGTDITAEKAVERFPNQNPNPVFRVDDQRHADLCQRRQPAADRRVRDEDR